MRHHLATRLATAALAFPRVRLQRQSGVTDPDPGGTIPSTTVDSNIP